MKTACHYAIARFMPFIETGEFANVGVVLFSPNLDRAGMLTLWAEIVKPRETMLRFSDSRLVMADDPEAKLRELYAYYVERSFLARETPEHALEKGVRGWLRGANLLNRFHPARVGNDEYHAQFPFVAGTDERPEKIIKPLNLGHADASHIIDHGGQWVVRLNALRS